MSLQRAFQGLLIAARTCDGMLHPQSAHALALHLRRLNTSALVAEDATSQAVAAQDPAAASLPDQAPSFNPNKYITYRTKRLGLIKVPDVPLPYYVSGQTKEKRAPLHLLQALEEVKEHARAKFAETIDIAINLGIDARRGDQNVRGAAVLPHGIGRTVKVAVFTEGDHAEVARQAGADIVGGEDLIDDIKTGGSGAIQFDKCLATPDMMGKISRIARILGPRGLMPSPKLGTVVTDVATAVKQMKAGRVEFRNDRGGVLHVPLGKVHFETEHLLDNTAALINTLLAMRPKGVRGGTGAGGYLLKAHISSTMGKSVPVSITSLVGVAMSKKTA